MSNSNETNNADSNNINTKQVVKIIGFIVLGIVGFYILNFHNGLSEKNEVWGTFGDYFGGILNPVIAAFAFYLIAKTYELQKRELEATRRLLRVSTDAQKEQIELAALTALFNSNLMRIGMLESEKIAVDQSRTSEPRPSMFIQPTVQSSQITQGHDAVNKKIEYIRTKINNLADKNKKLEERIEVFLREKFE